MSKYYFSYEYNDDSDSVAYDNKNKKVIYITDSDDKTINYNTNDLDKYIEMFINDNSISITPEEIGLLTISLIDNKPPTKNKNVYKIYNDFVRDYNKLKTVHNIDKFINKFKLKLSKSKFKNFYIC